MWSSSGVKLTGDYGTWNGQEVELDSTTPSNGTLLLIQHGGDRPDASWMTIDLGNVYPIPGIRHSLRVPAEEVSDIHAVRTAGEISPWNQVQILAENAEGKFAVVTGSDKQRLVDSYGFSTFSGEPVHRSHVFGWLPGEMVHNIESVVSWRKDDAS
ncbi:hypothetical protein [Arthrobacter zhaoxinii]|uniref:hypothetical protein n=1 Tax=Arthrobacter zhaoxinii TaxID=2964616 RepID=UPI0021020DFB|nr:hypothetical protein [Arthrobacter zhaoxinii]MCQ2001823.1 hypothetical protein [Arthrobacter zhaoxinii]